MNQVRLVGKISRIEKLKYTPAGRAILEFTLAVHQSFLEKGSVGYLTVVLTGEIAEEKAADLKIGKEASVEGTLWSRNYRNRRGDNITEIKILAESLS